MSHLFVRVLIPAIFALVIGLEAETGTAQSSPIRSTDGCLYFPTDDDWATVSFEDARCDPKGIQAALRLAGEKHSKGVVIAWRGRILAEQYWDDWKPTDPHPAYSFLRVLSHRWWGSRFPRATSHR
ncbi:MAG: hypothetical protein AAFU85_13035 [Planctomycetota bacterium]